MCPHGIGGPTPVAVRPDGVFDLSGIAPTVADLLDRADLARIAGGADLPRLASLEDTVAGSHPATRGPATLHFLSPSTPGRQGVRRDVRRQRPEQSSRSGRGRR
jgi:fumarylacetoacetate (FAA) hydrolase family protein